jgi:hypothetical protein
MVCSSLSGEARQMISLAILEPIVNDVQLGL